MLRSMYLVSPASKHGKSIDDLSRKRGKETPLVRQRQFTALELTKNEEVVSTYSPALTTKVKQLRHRSVAGLSCSDKPLRIADGLSCRKS
jgi:beta-xylosidase